jgi:hypothetical protein
MVAYCEVFLRGRYAERLMERAERVPPRAWLNLVAHGPVTISPPPASLGG